MVLPTTGQAEFNVLVKAVGLVIVTIPAALGKLVSRSVSHVRGMSAL